MENFGQIRNFPDFYISYNHRDIEKSIVENHDHCKKYVMRKNIYDDILEMCHEDFHDYYDSVSYHSP